MILLSSGLETFTREGVMIAGSTKGADVRLVVGVGMEAALLLWTPGIPPDADFIAILPNKFIALPFCRETTISVIDSLRAEGRSVP